jgi:uroporphyrin-III C-methyltransferase
MKKKLTIIGAGPGDPELLTIKGLRALQTADVVLYDALVNPILLEHAPTALQLYVGKRRGHKSYSQSEINNMIVELAQTHGQVVRLKGGDPFVFGRGYEEMEFAQAHGIDCEYIPGISSSIGVPGLAGIPVTHRNLSRSFWVVTATASDGSLSPDIHLAAQSDATVVVLMGLNKLVEIVEVFQANGKSELPVAVLQDGSLPTARSVFGTVHSIVQQVDNEQLGSPALIVLGEVVGLNIPARFSRRLQKENLLTEADY